MWPLSHITDSDHSQGFQDVFDNEKISFEHVYHNGLLERTGSQSLGPVDKGFLTDIRITKTAARNLYSQPTVRGRKRYPKLLWTALNRDRFDNISMLSTEHGQQEDGRTWMPGFAPSNNVKFTIEVLGPVVEDVPNGKQGFRTFPSSLTGKAMNVSKTKNGHSVLLRLQYRDFSVLIGGDLNTPAKHFLMRHNGNQGHAPTTIAETIAMIERVRTRFAVDLMKSCHHGALDVTDEFLEATRLAAFVVSSGDEESHVHPRPDLFGLLGKKGRGRRPLVAVHRTSPVDTGKGGSDAERGKLDKIVQKIAKETEQAKKKGLQQERAEILDELFKRNVGVYGSINLRTDGRRAVVAFRREQSKGVKRWFSYELEKDSQGIFQVQNVGGH